MSHLRAFKQSCCSGIIFVQKMPFMKITPLEVVPCSCFTLTSYTLCTYHCCNLWTSLTVSFGFLADVKASFPAEHICQTFAKLHVGVIICSFAVSFLLLPYLGLLLLKPLQRIETQAPPTDRDHVWNITTTYQVWGGSLASFSVNIACTDFWLSFYVRQQCDAKLLIYFKINTQ